MKKGSHYSLGEIEEIMKVPSLEGLEGTPEGCKCSFRGRALGDGCQHCNPELWKEHRERAAKEEAHFEAWTAKHEANLQIEWAESGADREEDFDPEMLLEQAYFAAEDGEKELEALLAAEMTENDTEEEG